MTPDQGRAWQALHENMQKELEAALSSLGWQYGPGEGLIAGIGWMKSEIERLSAIANEKPKQDRWWESSVYEECEDGTLDGVGHGQFSG